MMKPCDEPTTSFDSIQITEPGEALEQIDMVIPKNAAYGKAKFIIKKTKNDGNSNSVTFNNNHCQYKVKNE